MNKKWITIIIISLFILILGGFVIYHYYSTPIFKNPTFVESTNTSEEEVFMPNNKPLELNVDDQIEEQVYTFALFGTDERNNERSRTDTIIVVRYNSELQKMEMISIPRDTLVQIPGKGQDKINAAYAYGGHELAVQTLEQLLQIKIDNYARVNFNSFIDIVDTLGGVKVNAKKEIRWYDPDFKKDVYIEQGEQYLTGQTLLTYVRFRKDADGDFGRIERQREVILSIANDLIKTSNLPKYPDLIKILSKNVDSDLNIKTLLELAQQMNDFNSVQVNSHTLKTKSEKIRGIWFEKINDNDLNDLQKQLRDINMIHIDSNPQNKENSNSSFSNLNTNEPNGFSVPK